MKNEEYLSTEKGAYTLFYDKCLATTTRQIWFGLDVARIAIEDNITEYTLDAEVQAAVKDIWQGVHVKKNPKLDKMIKEQRAKLEKERREV